jgi:RNA polymerase primary sigma factor
MSKRVLDALAPPAAINCTGCCSRSAVRHETTPLPRKKHRGDPARRKHDAQSDDPRGRSLEQRAEQLLGEPITFIDHPAYRHEGLELSSELQTALDSRHEAQFGPSATQVTADASPAFTEADELPLLNKHEEAFLFCRMNYLKFRANRCLGQLDRESPSPWLIEEIERLLQESLAIRNHLVRANLRLVVFVAKGFADPHETLPDLFSDGTLSLIRAVEKFDFARGNRFSTYATRAIRNMFVRSHQKGRRHRQRHLTGFQENLDWLLDKDGGAVVSERTAQRKNAYLDELLGHLTDRERAIVTGRFALTVDGKKRTLGEIGATLGLSKERVRQISDRALEKLRAFADKHPVDFVDL